MGRYFTCADCGEQFKDQLGCDCASNRVKNLIHLKCGAVILETLYDDLHYPFVFVLEKLKLPNGNVLCMQTYVGDVGDGHGPAVPITQIQLTDFEARKMRLQEKDNEEAVEEAPEEDFGGIYTFKLLKREGKTRRGIFEKVSPGREDDVDRHFPERHLDDEEEKLRRTGWTLNTETKVWSKTNAVHKKEVKAAKKQEEEVKLISVTPTREKKWHEDPAVWHPSGRTVCGYRVSASPPPVCTSQKVHHDGLCSAHAKVGLHGSQ